MPKHTWRAALTFDAPSFASMHRAYELVCKRLHVEDAKSREVVVGRIVELVGLGEFNPDSLAKKVIEEAGPQLSRRPTRGR